MIGGTLPTTIMNPETIPRQVPANAPRSTMMGRGQPASTLQPMKIALIPKAPPIAISIPAVARTNEIPG